MANPWDKPTATTQGNPWDRPTAPAQQATPAPQGNPGFFGPIQDAYDDAVKPTMGANKFDTAAGDWGRGILDLAQPIMHPVKTAMSAMPHNYKELAEDMTAPGARQITGMVEGAHQDVKDEGWERAVPHIAGNIAGGVIAGEIPGMIDDIPRMGRAGRTLADLDTKLADTPVNLNHTTAPLQRATELSVRTGASPAPFNAFLSRTQGTEPMTFPEARDYQSGMSNPSVMDKLSTSGKMRGAVKQTNKAFFNDLKDAADTHPDKLGDQYAQGMSEYKNGARLKTAAKMAGAGAVASVVTPKLLKYLQVLGE